MEKEKLLFVSISDVANGAEQIILMSAITAQAPILFLKKEKQQCLSIPASQKTEYASKKSVLLGLFLLPFMLMPYRKNYRIMSTHPYLNAYLGLLKRIKFLKSKLVVRECSSIFTRYTGIKRASYKLAYKIGYPGVDLVVCQTEEMKKDFIQYNAFFAAQNVLVRANPIHKQSLLAAANHPIHEILTFGKYLCAAGRLIPEKGFDTLIHAFALVKKVKPELNLLILGEGPERANLIALIHQLRLQNSVILKGWVANPMPYFKQAKACILSSVKEGFPNVLLQMMLLNATVISTRCAGGIAEIPGIYTVAVNDPLELSLKISTALDNVHTDAVQQKEDYLKKRSPQAFLDSIFSTP